MDLDHFSLSFPSSVETNLILREPKHFFVVGPGTSVGNLNSYMTAICYVSNPISVCGGKYTTVSSMIDMGDAVSTTDSVTKLALGVEITILFEKRTYFDPGIYKEQFLIQV